MKVLGELINGVFGIISTACFLAVGVVVALYYAGNIGIVQFGKHLVLITLSY